jgi:hypothetical protein
MSGFTHPLDLSALLSVHWNAVPLIWFVEVIRRCWYNKDIVSWPSHICRQLVASFSLWRPAFNTRLFHMGFMVGKVAVGHTKLWELQFSCVKYHYTIILYLCVIRGCYNTLQRDSICTLFLLQERLYELQDFIYGGKTFEILECICSIDIECPYVPQLPH